MEKCIMNGKDRLLAVLNGEIPDRVPVNFFVQEEFLSFMYPGRRVDRVKDAVECALNFDFDIMTRSKLFSTPYFKKKSYPNWDLNKKTVRESGNYYEIFEINTPQKTLKQVEVCPDVGNRVEGIHLSTMEYLIKDDSDLEAFCKYVPGVDKKTVEEVNEYCRWSKEVIGNNGISVPWGMAGVYNHAATLRDNSLLMMDPLINSEFYETYMNKLTELAIEFNSILAKANRDAIGLEGNIANSAMVGSRVFYFFFIQYF
jgi:uroporphyrinogen decarboxylase